MSLVVLSFCSTFDLWTKIGCSQDINNEKCVFHFVLSPTWTIFARLKAKFDKKEFPYNMCIDDGIAIAVVVAAWPVGRGAWS